MNDTITVPDDWSITTETKDEVAFAKGPLTLHVDTSMRAIGEFSVYLIDWNDHTVEMTTVAYDDRMERNSAIDFAEQLMS